MSILDHFSATTFPWGRRPPTLDEIVKTAQRAEELGYSTMNIAMVNVLVNAGPFARYENKYTLDALAVLPAMVTATKNIPIVVDAIPLPQLPPFEWAKYFSSLDVIQGTQ